MKDKYIDLIHQTFDFPSEEFEVNDEGELSFRGLDLMDIAKRHGTPLQITYLPKVSENIQNARKWFNDAIEKNNYKGTYNFSYCTKSSHYKHILREALRNDVHIETSSAYDLEIVRALHRDGLLSTKKFILCNGLKTEGYINRIVGLIEDGFSNLIVILDNKDEIDLFEGKTNKKIKVGIRIASEEEPKFEFWTSRLGIGYRFIVPFYESKLKKMPNVELVMLHFFINTGIKDTAYYWNELKKCVSVYSKLKHSCASLSCLNIGGGFPIKRSLNFDYDYAYMADEIIALVGRECENEEIPHPDIFTEFGSFTVGESGINIFSVLRQKQQNDRERWNMIDGSFMTSLPDAWAINERFIMLPINNWHGEYERILLGGLTCDSDDYYNSEQHVNAIYLPKYKKENNLMLAFFNTGAYQDSLSGYGGLKHCLIPGPKKLLIRKDDDGNLVETVFSDEQSSEGMLKLLGY